jgi:hypothetical protein
MAIRIVRNPPMVNSRVRVYRLAPTPGIYGPAYGPKPPTAARVRRGRR